MADDEQCTVSNASMVGILPWNISARRLGASHLSRPLAPARWQRLVTGANTLAREAAVSLIDFRIPPNHRRYTGNNNSEAHTGLCCCYFHCIHKRIGPHLLKLFGFLKILSNNLGLHSLMRRWGFSITDLDMLGSVNSIKFCFFRFNLLASICKEKLL